MKDGYPEPNRHYDSQCGEFRDAVLELIKIYDEKHGIKRLSQFITLSGKLVFMHPRSHRYMTILDVDSKSIKEKIET